MALTNPVGSGMPLGDFIEILCKAVNRSYNLTGDDTIQVTQHDQGRSITVPHKREPFFAKIIGWLDLGETGKRWKYIWQEVDIGEGDGVIDIDNGNRGGRPEEDGPTTYLINLAEMNNTTGANKTQGNGMELVAPIGGGTPSADDEDNLDGVDVEHQTIVPVWTSKRSDGSVLYWTNITNSDHILTNEYDILGSAPANDESHTGIDTDNYELEDLNSEKSYESGVGLQWFVDQRTNYRHTDSTPALRAYYRQFKIRPNGKIESVLRETVCTVDAPEVCDNGE